jgi:hypothetical protein
MNVIKYLGMLDPKERMVGASQVSGRPANKEVDRVVSAR